MRTDGLRVAVQVDAWLEARGPAMTLHGAIDDATSTVLALHFRPTEDLHGYAIVFQQMFTQYGRPLALYGDRINILVRHDAHWSLAEQLRGAQDPTHLGRVLHDLGIGYLAAGSPKANGRVERLWRTLQDRLSRELRLRHITTPEGANALLPEFLADLNPRFTRPPSDPAPAWRVAPRDLPLVLSCRYSRQVARDNTVRLGPRWIQLPPGGRDPRHATGAPPLRPHAPQRPERRAAPPGPTSYPTQNAPAPDRAAPQPAQDQRGPTQPRSPYPPQRGFPRPAARHPWRRAITKNAQCLYPVKG